MYHKITIVGNLGRDPEMRFTPSGKPVTNFSVAANRRWTNADGTPGEETTWFRVSAWGRMAEVCNEYLQKGRLVMVEGTMITGENGGPRIWTGNDGVARASFEVNASLVKFLGGSRDNGTTEEEGPPPADEPDTEELLF